MSRLTQLWMGFVVIHYPSTELVMTHTVATMLLRLVGVLSTPLQTFLKLCCVVKIIGGIRMKAKQIEWDNLRGIVGGYRRYYIWDCPVGKNLPGEQRVVVDTSLTASHEVDIALTGTIYKSIDQAKQACQDHLQQYVDGLLLQLQQLTQVEPE